MMQQSAKLYMKCARLNPEFPWQMKSLTPSVMRAFSTDSVSKNYDLFRKRYTESVAVFRNRM